jgi:DNA-directed RNA polymerase specialized sigma24 family protein
MNRRKNDQFEKVPATQYANSEDFCQVFTENMSSLFWLAFLLTADHEKAEQCFVAGLGDSVQANRVFQSWAHSWAKRTIAQNAIHMLKPRPGTAGAPDALTHTGDSRSAGDFEFSCVLALQDFERFVFVMSVLERYSDHECALLLDCRILDIHEARSRALQQIGDSPCSAQPGSVVRLRREDDPKAAAAAR